MIQYITLGCDEYHLWIFSQKVTFPTENRKPSEPSVVLAGKPLPQMRLSIAEGALQKQFPRCCHLSQGLNRESRTTEFSMLKVRTSTKTLSIGSQNGE